MLFITHVDITPEHRNEAFERFLAFGSSSPHDVKIVGHWFATTLLEAWVVIEAADSTELGKLFRHWTDLNVNHITPVIEEENIRQVFS